MEVVDFEVDVGLFIDEVKQHRSIWDMRSEDYKDRGIKQSAWEDVCNNTFMDFQTKSQNERNSIIKKLTLKWKNIKDNYMRNVRKRTKSGQPVRKYIYAKHLSFLQESMALAATQSSTEDPSLDSPLSQTGQDEESSSYHAASSDPATPQPTRGASRSAAGRRQDLESSLIQYMNTPVIVDISDSNRLFFDSLVPMIQNFTEDQTLQFRSEVIELIRRIKRQSMVPPETHTTVSPPPNNN